MGIEQAPSGNVKREAPLSRGTIPTGQIVMTAMAVFFFLLLAASPLIAIWAGYAPEWSGLRGAPLKETTTTSYAPGGEQTALNVATEVVPKRTGWDWISVAFIPLIGALTIAAVGYLFNIKQREREEAVQSLRAQDEALQQYLDQMSDLLCNQNLRSEPEGSKPKWFQKFTGEANDISRPKGSTRDLAQARSKAVLLSLDKEHKRRPLKLVHELGLIKKGSCILELKNAGLDGADLSELTLHDAYLKRIDLRIADLKGADLEGCDLTLADLRGANLWRADLKGANLEQANLLPYDEQDPERFSFHNLGKIDWSKERLRPLRLALVHKLRLSLAWHTFHKLRWRAGRLPMSKLTLTNLRGAIFTSNASGNARLCKAILCGADLTRAELTHADLTEAKLKEANLKEADLKGADLTGANLQSAYLEGANLREANLREANLRGAKKLVQEQLEQAIGDETTKLPKGLHTPASWTLGQGGQAEEDE